MVRHVALSFGVRYDLQTFNTAGLQPNPAWPEAGKLPVDTNNVSPRVGFAWSIGDTNPLIVRGGYGMFYTRIPHKKAPGLIDENLGGFWTDHRRPGAQVSALKASLFARW